MGTLLGISPSEMCAQSLQGQQLWAWGEAKESGCVFVCILMDDIVTLSSEASAMGFCGSHGVPAILSVPSSKCLVLLEPFLNEDFCSK